MILPIVPYIYSLRIHLTQQTADTDTTVSITVVGLSLEPDSPLARDPDIKKLFVEYQFLNIGYGELETPESLPKPRPGEMAMFNFRKGEQICLLNSPHFSQKRVPFPDKVKL